jgi:hypothetical protein
MSCEAGESLKIAAIKGLYIENTYSTSPMLNPKDIAIDDFVWQPGECCCGDEKLEDPKWSPLQCKR